MIVQRDLINDLVNSFGIMALHCEVHGIERNDFLYLILSI